MKNIETTERGSLPEHHFPSENHLTNLLEGRYARRSAHLSATLAITQAPICQNTFETKHLCYPEHFGKTKHETFQ